MIVNTMISVIDLSAPSVAIVQGLLLLQILM